MSTAKITARQYLSKVMKEITFKDLGNSFTFDLAPGEYLESMTCDVETAFNAGTTNTITVTDGTTTFMNAVTIGATGNAAVSNTGKFYPSGGTITITPSSTGTAATAGDLIFTASIVTQNRQDYTYGT